MTHVPSSLNHWLSLKSFSLCSLYLCYFCTRLASCFPLQLCLTADTALALLLLCLCLRPYMSIIWTPSPYINSMYPVLRLQFEYRIWLTPPTPRALTALLWLACSHLVTSLYLPLWPTPKYGTTEHADKGTPHKVKPSPNHTQLQTSSELPLE